MSSHVTIHNDQQPNSIITLHLPSNSESNILNIQNILDNNFNQYIKIQGSCPRCTTQQLHQTCAINIDNVETIMLQLKIFKIVQQKNNFNIVKLKLKLSGMPKRYNNNKQSKIYFQKCNFSSRKHNRRRNSASIEDGGSSARQDADAGEDGSATCYFAQQKLESPKVLLATAQIVLADESGNQVQVRTMIDPGSERSFVTERVLTALCVSSSKVHINLHVMGDQCSSTVRKQTQLFLRSRIDANFSVRAKSLVMPELTGLLPTARLPEDHWPHLRGIVFADPTYYKPDKVEFVIGAELIPFIMLEGLRKESIGSPLGQYLIGY
uniref:Peptidase aspartic putative domain-containing protein n=1 Tax=Trichogramma kaykai TaxID=54128 RepID=A0ABD2WEC4_9HYME